ncbi:MAG TPA: bacteriocin fulvocin C-related protein [Vicinamibacterales bacterium]|nr:bacteriocin fulvocin C-related protein [Vicinamibacterales bacterium]
MKRSVPRRVFLAVFVLMLTLPAESVLVRALAAPDQAVAAQQWTTALTQDDLVLVASQVEAYPFVYRRAIMRALSPDARAWIWRNHILAYLQMHPELDANAAQLIQQAAALATPETMSGDRSNGAQIGLLATEIQATLGRDVADFLLYRLGPKDARLLSSALPVRERLANFTRSQFLALAGFNPDCDCSSSFGCDQGRCDSGSGCNVDDTWPMCGWLWDQECDGNCKGGVSG